MAEKARGHRSVELSWDQVRAFRLERHHLTDRLSARQFLRAAADIAGVQAQMVSASWVSFWARTRNLRVGALERAVDPDRTLTRATVMRGTLHFVPSFELALFARGTTKRAEREVRYMRGRGLTSRTIDAFLDAIVAALDEPMTRREVARQVSRELRARYLERRGGGWGSRSPVPCVRVGGVTWPMVYLLLIAGARGVICRGPPHAGEPTFVRADRWLSGWRDMAVPDAEEELLRRYLQAYAPATATDFARWSGMGLRDGRAVWARVAEEIVPVRVDGWEAGALRDDLPALEKGRGADQGVHLLPHFDSYLLGHQERAHLVDPEKNARVYRSQGWVSPVVLVGGRVAGTWSHTVDRAYLRIRITSFVPLGAGIRKELKELGADLGAFLGRRTVEMRVG